MKASKTHRHPKAMNGRRLQIMIGLPTDLNQTVKSKLIALAKGSVPSMIRKMMSIHRPRQVVSLVIASFSSA